MKLGHRHNSPVTPENAKNELAKRINQSGKTMADLTPAEGIRLMLDFYRDIRADNCNLVEDGDMLLFQWGTWDWGNGRSFQFNITRQFIRIHSEDDDDATSQLSFTFHFPPSPQFDALKNGNRWCHTPEGLAEFEPFILAGDPHQAVATKRPTKVTLDYGGI